MKNFIITLTSLIIIFCNIVQAENYQEYFVIDDQYNGFSRVPESESTWHRDYFQIFGGANFVNIKSKHSNKISFDPGYLITTSLGITYNYCLGF